jgi:hypothetical protein
MRQYRFNPIDAFTRTAASMTSRLLRRQRNDVRAAPPMPAPRGMMLKQMERLLAAQGVSASTPKGGPG